MLALTALELESDLLGNLGLLLEDWLLLTAESLLLVVISSSSLSEERLFTLFVLGDLVLGVTLAIKRTVGSSGFLKGDHRL
jgi:hypothetical protein